ATEVSRDLRVVAAIATPAPNGTADQATSFAASPNATDLIRSPVVVVLSTQISSLPSAFVIQPANSRLPSASSVTSWIAERSVSLVNGNSPRKSCRPSDSLIVTT